MLGYQMENIREIPILPITEIFTHYYFRFSALDRPGVLSNISGILGKYDISIKVVLQYDKIKLAGFQVVLGALILACKFVEGALALVIGRLADVAGFEELFLPVEVSFCLFERRGCAPEDCFLRGNSCLFNFDLRCLCGV